MQRFKNMLLVAGGETGEETAFQRAVTLAENNQAKLTVINVLEGFPPEKGDNSHDMWREKLHKAMISEQLDHLDSMIQTVRKEIQVSAGVFTGTSFLEIIRTVLKSNHDLVMKTAQDAGHLRKLLFGSADMHLLRKCPCPVWIMKPGESSRYGKILAAVDGNPSDNNKSMTGLNRQILEIAASLALSEFSQLHIVHAWEVFGESSLRSGRFRMPQADIDAHLESEKQAHAGWMDALMAKFTEMLGKDTIDYLKPQVHLAKGAAHKIIPMLANEKQVDLVVMGTVARTGLQGFFMGNTAENILNQLDCSVLAVKPNGFVTPVTLE